MRKARGATDVAMRQTHLPRAGPGRGACGGNLCLLDPSPDLPIRASASVVAAAGVIGHRMVDHHRLETDFFLASEVEPPIVVVECPLLESCLEPALATPVLADGEVVELRVRPLTTIWQPSNRDADLVAVGDDALRSNFVDLHAIERVFSLTVQLHIDVKANHPVVPVVADFPRHEVDWADE